VRVSFTVNGAPYDLDLPPRRLLSDALRHDLRLTGTHVGCEHGVCGACTVLVDGAPMRSCLLFAVSLDGAAITTTEGLRSPGGGMGPVQQAFHECHALQCGFCTPGFVTTVAAFLETNADPTPEEAREAISGNLCRCTGYVNIVAAVCRAGELLRLGAAPAGLPEGAAADGRTEEATPDGRTEEPAATVDGSGGRREAPDGFGAAGSSGSPAGDATPTQGARP
jgi:carbon-monoxide dehydrogenase small subunit